MTIKKLYALQAHGERGKTTTLKMLVLKILKNYNTVFNYTDDGKTLTADELQKQLEDERKSGENIINICGTIHVKGIVIAVNTAGDNEYEVSKSINLFKSAIDIGICAIRTKGITLNKLNEFAENSNLRSGLEYFIINKMSLSNNYGYNTRCPMIDTMNKIQAEMLWNELQSNF